MACGPLQALSEEWELPGENIRATETYHQVFQNCLQLAQQWAHDNLEEAQH